MCDEPEVTSRLQRGGVALALATIAATACVIRERAPTERARDARFGFLRGDPTKLDRIRACGHWGETVGRADPNAMTHTSFPETDRQTSCFTPVTHSGSTVAPADSPPGCAAPSAVERAAMLALAERLDAMRTEPLGDDRRSAFPCSLTPRQRQAAAEHNASVLRVVASLPASFPYSAILVPGFGVSAQAETSIASWVPGDACHVLSDLDRVRLGAMVLRTRRALDAFRGGVAPMVIATGGSPHSPLVEAFAMLHLLACGEGPTVPETRVLVEPCAEHTHTNLRNAGRWLVAMGSRVGYLVTDDGLQADYFQDWTGLNLLTESLDARSLRDWGYVVGSWRQASMGTDAGFWFTPYRFWAEPQPELGAFTCVTSDE
jgi:hypothetical protein